MIKLAYCNVADLDLERSYRLLPENRKNKVDHFRFKKDKCLSAGAFLLLRKMLEEENVVKPIFEFGKYDKSYISNYENIYFNLSHSGKIAACAISDKEIGVDVEYIDFTIDLDIAKNYFFNMEYDSIMHSNNPSVEFFNYWVLKESYMKYTGLGFNLNLDEFEIVIDDNIYLNNDKNNLEFSLFDLDEYKLATCGHYKINDVKEYSIDDLY